MDGQATLERRFANFRAGLARGGTAPADGRAEPRRRRPSEDRLVELAEVLGGRSVRAPGGTYLELEAPSVSLPIDRHRLADLPWQAPIDAPLICLDTETTGLATAAGTLAFLVGLGWWDGDSFRQVQLLLPDHADEPALLDALAGRIPAGSWLVTYNGRGFDWPLLVTRYRMARRDAPPLGGHVDLLPLVRRIFRHRLADARLRTVESDVLGLRRHADVEGWEIPGRYFEYLRGGSPATLAQIVTHNHEDVRSLARLLAHVEQRFGQPNALADADPGDVAGLGRAYLRVRRLDRALECLDAALNADDRRASTVPSIHERAAAWAAPRPVAPPRAALDDWWSPRRRADFGGLPEPQAQPAREVAIATTPWTHERMAVDRAHVLRRLGRLEEAADAWASLAAGPTRLAAVAAVELAKLREHRLGDVDGALQAAERARAILERRRRLGRPEPGLERDVGRRLQRLRIRLARRTSLRPMARPA